MERPTFKYLQKIAHQHQLPKLLIRNFANLADSQDILSQYLQLRKKYALKYSPAVQKLYPRGVHGLDTNSNPVYYQNIGQCDLNQLKNISSQAWISFYIKQVQRLLKVCDQIQKRGKRGSKLTVVLNCKGPILKLSNKKNYETMEILFNFLSKFYNDVVKSIMLVNAPMLFSSVWPNVQKIVSPDTLAKVSIHGTDFLKKLSVFVQAENIPKMLMGKCSCLEEDCIKQWKFQIQEEQQEQIQEDMEELKGFLGKLIPEGPRKIQSQTPVNTLDKNQ